MTRSHGLIRQRFGHLVVRERTPYRNKHGDVHWLCECDCGGNKEASTHSLRRGDVVSCGCLRLSKSGTCSVKGCRGKVYAKGLCAKHYMRALRHDGDTSDRPRTTICIIEGCGGKVNAKGLCRKHYQRSRRPDRKRSDRPRIVRTCSVDECDDKAIKHGLCNKHYQRARRHDGDTSDRLRITICTIEGCGGKVRAKGLCAKHYMRALRHDGDTSDRPCGGSRKTELRQTLPKPLDKSTLRWFQVEPADDRHCRLRHPRPRHRARRTCDELSPSQT